MPDLVLALDPVPVRVGRILHAFGQLAWQFVEILVGDAAVGPLDGYQRLGFDVDVPVACDQHAVFADPVGRGVDAAVEEVHGGEFAFAELGLVVVARHPFEFERPHHVRFVGFLGVGVDQDGKGVGDALDAQLLVERLIAAVAGRDFEVAERAFRGLIQRGFINLIRLRGVLDVPDHSLDHVSRVGVARRIDGQRLEVRLVHARLVGDLVDRPEQLVERQAGPAAVPDLIAQPRILRIPLVAGCELEVDLRFLADVAFGFLGEFVALFRGCDEVFVGFSSCHSPA